MRAPASGDLPNLDLLRAVAVLLVLADHVLEAIGLQTAIDVHPYDLYAGHLGVLLFFVHTSFVLMASMERLDLGGAALLRAFYLRRAFRIFPLSVLCVLGVVALGVPALPWGEYVAPSASTLAANLSLTMNLSYSPVLLGPLWSLPVELQMYAVLPFLYLLLKRDRPFGRLAAVYAIALVLAWLTVPWGKRFALFEFAPCFVSGVACWVLARRVVPRVSGMLMLPLLALVTVAYMAGDDRLAGIHPPALAWATCLAVGLALPFVAQSRLARLNAAAHQVAKYSYGIYLFHCVAIYYGCYVLRAPLVVQWTVAATLLVVLSVASYHWLERPAIALGARLAAPRGRGVVPSP